MLVHGGPVSQPEDAEYILKNTKNCHGFYGASSMERLPTEVALTEQTRKFKAISAYGMARGAERRRSIDMAAQASGALILWLIIAGDRRS